MGLFNFKRNQESTQRKIIAALMDGRHLSVYNGREFRCAEMHTEFCRIRKKIVKGTITGFMLCSTWRTNENGVRYKEYWFQRTNG